MRSRFLQFAFGAILSTTSPAYGEVLISTDKSEYLPGESVTVMIENNLATEIIMYCDLPWRVLSVPADEWIALCSCAAWIISLGPGGLRTDTVEQLNCDTSEDEAWPAGAYSVVLEYQIGLDPDTRTTVTDEFCIGVGCSVTQVTDPGLPSTWGWIKSGYR